MHKYKTHVALKNGRGRAPERVIAELLEALFAEHKAPVLIAVGGPGGTGKSSFADLLAEQLEAASILRLDHYKTARSFRTQRNVFGPHPDANKLDMLKDHLVEMKAGRRFSHPVYDREKGEAVSSQPYKSARFNLLDGEISTYRDFREMVDFSIFIDSDWKTQLATRVERDVTERGYNREHAIATFLQSNLREFSEYGLESKKWADIHLYCDEDYHLMIESVSDQLFADHESLFEPDYAQISLSGLVVPVLTPFNEKNEIDPRVFIQHLEFLAQRGVHRIMLNGTTAEFYALLPEERKTLLKLARRYFPGMILLHLGGGSLRQNLEEVRWATDCGADAVVALPPYYPAELPAENMVAYLCALEDAAEVPFILYNFPKHTGNPLTPEILRQVPHAALKDSGKNMDLVAATPRYFIGSSTEIFPAMEQGSVGFVSATANVRPELYVGLEKAWVEGDVATANRLQNEILVYSGKFSAGGVAMLKSAMALCLPDYPARVRLPLR